VKTELSKADFIELLTKHNTNSVVIKFGAEWCGPCKQIDPYIYQYMSQMPEDVQCFVLDIDDEASFDLYAFLKSKRMVNGVPVLLAYKAGNVSWVPDDVTVGANSENVHLFFQRRLIKK
jgi:thiol-disulfide isomerase/thioredoxin